MDWIPAWQGLAREWQLAVAGWHALPDNPLWVLQQHIARHRGPRARRSLAAAAVVWGGVLLLFYGFLFTVAVNVSGWPAPDEFAQMVVVAFLVPAAGLFVMYATARLSLQGQTWLGRERGDARNVQAAMLDQQLALTRIEARDVVLASLRSLAPLLLAASGAGAVAATLVLLAMTHDSGSFVAALLTLPLTLVGYFVPGALGGLVLLWLSICLGLNSVNAAQRTALVCVLLLHQFLGFSLSLSLLGVLDMGGGNELAAMGGPFLAHIYVLLSALAGLWVVERSRAGTGWLLGVPVAWVGGFWLLAAVAGIYSSLGSFNWESGVLGEFAGALLMGMLSAWSAINLFSTTCLVTPYSFGDTGSTGTLLLPLAYLLRLGLLVALVVLGYRAALYCAALRLRAME
jgi:hypothetical protein